MASFAGGLVLANPEPHTGLPDGKTSQTEWLKLDKPSDVAVDHTDDVVESEHRKDGPVLLPLPAEGWASVTILLSMAAFRGLKRARLI